MGRAEKRKINKTIGKDTVDKVAEIMSREYTKHYINEKCENYKNNLIDSLEEAMKKNGLTNSQMKRICADLELILKRKVNGIG